MSDQHAARTVRLLRLMRTAKATKRRVRVPRQLTPVTLQNEYARRLSAFVTSRVQAAFAPFIDQLPAILASSHADMRLDAELRMDIGEGKRIRELIAQAREHMQRSIMTPDLEDLARAYGDQIARFQKVQLARQTRVVLGIDPFITDKRLLPLTHAFIDSNVGYIKGLTDDVASRIEKRTLDAVQDGLLYDDFAEQLQVTMGFSASRSELIARDQSGKLYGQLNAARQRELGVDKFIWRTSNDERVRDEHQELEGQTFSYDDPPDEGLPGEPIQCRCTAEPDFSSILDAADIDMEAPDDLQVDVPDTTSVQESLGQPRAMPAIVPELSSAVPIVEHETNIAQALSLISPLSDINVPAGYQRFQYNNVPHVRNAVTGKSYKLADVLAGEVHLRDLSDKELAKAAKEIARGIVR